MRASGRFCGTSSWSAAGTYARGTITLPPSPPSPPLKVLDVAVFVVEDETPVVTPLEPTPEPPLLTAPVIVVDAAATTVSSCSPNPPPPSTATSAATSVSSVWVDPPVFAAAAFFSLLSSAAMSAIANSSELNVAPVEAPMDASCAAPPVFISPYLSSDD